VRPGAYLVELDADERDRVARVWRSLRRFVDSHPVRHYFDPADPAANDLTALESEYAASVVTGLEWRTPYVGFADRHRGDLAGEVEVRSTPREYGGLLIRLEDDASRRYVLVTGSDGRYVVRGWRWGWEVTEGICGIWWEKAPRYPCWRVAQFELYDMAQLKGGRYPYAPE
jgi:hypothetical protein